MKKVIVFIFVIVIAVVCIVYSRYMNYKKIKLATYNINKEFLAYQNSKIRINTVISLMGSAIEKNKKNDIQMDETKHFYENDVNSIKLYLEVKSSDEVTIVRIPMEELIIGEKAGSDKVEKAFGESFFIFSDIKYHEKSGQVSQIVFKEIE